MTSNKRRYLSTEDELQSFIREKNKEGFILKGNPWFVSMEKCLDVGASVGDQGAKWRTYKDKDGEGCFEVIYPPELEGPW